MKHSWPFLSLSLSLAVIQQWSPVQLLYLIYKKKMFWDWGAAIKAVSIRDFQRKGDTIFGDDADSQSGLTAEYLCDVLNFKVAWWWIKNPSPDVPTWVLWVIQTKIVFKHTPWLLLCREWHRVYAVWPFYMNQHLCLFSLRLNIVHEIFKTAII